MVRRKDDGRYEIIAGHRRVQAVRDYTDWKTIPAQIIKVDDLQARRISAAENLQREDLSAIEEVEAIVEIVDAALIQDKEYALMGNNPANRVKALLRKLDSVRGSKERGSKVSKPAIELFGKFAEQLKNIFKTLPKHLEWQTFYRHDLPLVIDFCKEVQKASMQNGLNGAQTWALQKLQHRTGNFKGLQLLIRDLQSRKWGMSAKIRVKQASRK